MFTSKHIEIYLKIIFHLNIWQTSCNQEGREGGRRGGRGENKLISASIQIIFKLSTAHDATDHTANPRNRSDLQTAHSAKWHFWRKLFLHLCISRGCHKVPFLCSDSIFKIPGVSIASWVMEVSHWGGSVIYTITKLLSIRNELFFGDGN